MCVNRIGMIELIDPNDARMRLGFLLIEKDGHADVYVVLSSSELTQSLPGGFSLLFDGSAKSRVVDAFPRWALDYAKNWSGLLLCLLAMINTPRIVGRRQHMPHRGLEKDLLRARPVVGKFPLHAWTEIKLEVSPPRIENSDVHEAHLTGARALHFCRAHLRIRNGYLEIVRAHWRGDASLGIKQSRYSVIPARKRA